MSWQPNPFLHVETESIYNPLTDRTLRFGEEGFELLRRMVGAEWPAASQAELSELESNGWIVSQGKDLSRQSHLRIVSLETSTVCNQACYFCPVSIAPREDVTMTGSLFDDIVTQLMSFRQTLQSVFLQSYNEPTIDRRFVEQCRALMSADLPVAVLSNGSGLTAAKVDALIEGGGLRYLAINLSTLDRERYAAERGGDHLAMVLRNLDYLKGLPLAEQMNMVVLGTGNETHQRDYEAIRDRFAGSRFEVQHHVVMDRAGWLDIGLHAASPKRRLAGCDNIGSRPIQHLHITPKGTCVLCCEDYDENYVVGDLRTATISEVLAGPELARMRRWVYGIEEAPEDFMCRKCIFARTRE